MNTIFFFYILVMVAWLVELNMTLHSYFEGKPWCNNKITILRGMLNWYRASYQSLTGTVWYGTVLGSVSGPSNYKKIFLFHGKIV